jgi:acyl-CoA thioesterase-2
MEASFQTEEHALDVDTETMPPAAMPETLAPDTWSPLIDRRLLPADIGPGRVGGWLRLAEDLGDDPVLNACALAYLSDDLATDAVVARHPDRPPPATVDRPFWNASLDHAIWFLRPSRAHDWHLHDFTCRGLVGTRGLSSGAIFDRTGRHVATVTQEVLIRSRRST